MKWITWIVAVIILVAGGWYFVKNKNARAPQAVAPQQKAEVPAPPPVPQSAFETTGTENTDLDQNLAQIDASMQATAAEGNSVQTFTDTSVAQTE